MRKIRSPVSQKTKLTILLIVHTQHRNIKIDIELMPLKYISRNVATLAQLVEHLTCNEDVVGSIPTGGSIFNKRAYPSRVGFFSADFNKCSIVIYCWLL